MVRTTVGRAFALGVAGFVISAACACAQEDFPFEHELLLDAHPMKGSKRIPVLSVEPDGTATIDLWCKQHASANQRRRRGHFDFDRREGQPILRAGASAGGRGTRVGARQRHQLALGRRKRAADRGQRHCVSDNKQTDEGEMRKEIIKTDVPETGGPFNLCVRHGGMIYISGLPPFDEDYAGQLRAARAAGNQSRRSRTYRSNARCAS